jgi:hypothetical protein
LGPPQKAGPPDKYAAFPLAPLDKPAGFLQDVPKAPPGMIAPPPGVTQASLSLSSNVRVQVRAWVNGRPIFHDELIQAAGPDLNRVMRSAAPGQQGDEVTKLLNVVLEQIIDQEVMYQDAVKKLEKNNPPALVKMKEYVDLEFDKSLKRMRDAKTNAGRFREVDGVQSRRQQTASW